MTAAETTGPEAPHLGWPAPAGAVNQPRRALLAAGEVVVAALLVWLAVWLYGRGIQPLSRVEARPDLDFEHYAGNWVGGAVAAATVAGLLLLDALRQLVLAVRTGSRKA
ncbi:hypothetical protein [Actinokineospora sp. NBRC 105648]|uniref:hypothetical protein n=1 Tax=Actinokineospora sp. NBRC 105648 TaxID=3032206 RepID=UPI0024A3E6AB|nr:hypothetical protein [Actinokineospora sp. NBRC 105648]GLZ38207.1 hypothetical protein Acsp05_18310 [Actinokineospora sp. NBRC 105648]